MQYLYNQYPLLAAAIEFAAGEQGCDDALAKIQDALGVDDGGFAAMHFMTPENSEELPGEEGEDLDEAWAKATPSQRRIVAERYAAAEAKGIEDALEDQPTAFVVTIRDRDYNDDYGVIGVGMDDETAKRIALRHCKNDRRDAEATIIWAEENGDLVGKTDSDREYIISSHKVEE